MSNRTEPLSDTDQFIRAASYYTILLGMADGPVVADVAAALTDRGWTVVVTADLATLVAYAATHDPALLLLYGPLPDGDARRVAARVAQLPPPRGAVPILAVAAGAALPTDAAIRASIDGTPRVGVAPPDPITRLAPLFGAAGIATLLRRFRNRLALLIHAPDPYAIGEGATPALLAHRIAGIAGTLDFALLADAWHRVERDGPADLPDAWFETRVAHATLTFLLDRRAVR